MAAEVIIDRALIGQPGERALKDDPIIWGRANLNTYATDGVLITPAIINTALATAKLPGTVSAIERILTLGPDEALTNYGGWDDANQKMKAFVRGTDAEASNLADLSDETLWVPFMAYLTMS